jgi:hypothetical protein
MENAIFRSSAARWSDLSGRDLLEERTNPALMPLRTSFGYQHANESTGQLAEQNISLEDEIVDRNFQEIVGNNMRLKAALENVRIRYEP